MRGGKRRKVRTPPPSIPATLLLAYNEWSPAQTFDTDIRRNQHTLKKMYLL